MCSINGFTWEHEALGRAMNEATKHRGPDATAVFIEDGITLAHNRLAILDLSPEANQPMHDASGRYTIVFNGQIYNFKELREELGAYQFKTTGDTEVILAAYARWGKECVEHFDGMFAFALWDKEKKELFVARDHQGIKPFFYWQEEGKFIFSSEIAGLLAHPLPRRLNKKSFGLYMQLLYPPSPETMIEGVMKLPAASRGYVRNGSLSFESYWSARGSRPLATGEWSEKVEKEIDASVKRQLISDRPVGVYLSGGIDSSVVLDSVSRVRKNIDTFSVGFDLTEGEQREKFNADFDLARKTAKHYGTRHHEVLFSASDAVSVFPEAVLHLGEPIANPTILPMYALAQFARKTAVVVLGGDGGDELFGGYERYRRSLMASTYQRLFPSSLRNILSLYGPFRKLNTKAGAERIAFFMAQKKNTIQRALAPGTALPSIEEVFTPYVSSGAFENNFMEVDRQTWLTDESLAMTDTMTMSAGLEARVPLLGKRVVELAVQIPLSEKVSLWNTKLILKKAFAYRLPKYLFSQPKRGWFSPGAKWLRKEPFRSFAQGVLTANYYPPTAALFNWQEVQKMFLEHESGGYHLNTLWAVLTFQVWARAFKITLQ